MKCIVRINGRFLIRVVSDGKPIVSESKSKAMVMDVKQAFTMANHFEEEFGMKTAVLQLVTMYSHITKKQFEGRGL